MVTRGFVVGCPRSGTTLAQAMLAGHPDLLAVPETHFFQRCYGPRGTALQALRARPALRRTRELVGQPSGSVPWTRAACTAAFVATLDEAAARAGRAVWVEKTPNHVHFLPAIRRHVPGAVVLHVLRDGRATIASLHRLGLEQPGPVWGRYRSLATCIRKWRRSMADSLRHLPGPGHAALLYEDMTQRPTAALERASRLLGLDFHPAMLDPGAGAAPLLEGGVPWKAAVAEGLRARGLADYETLLSAVQRRQVEAAIADLERRRLALGVTHG